MSWDCCLVPIANIEVLTLSTNSVLVGLLWLLSDFNCFRGITMTLGGLVMRPLVASPGLVLSQVHRNCCPVSSSIMATVVACDVYVNYDTVTTSLHYATLIQIFPVSLCIVSYATVHSRPLPVQSLDEEGGRR